MSLVYFNRWTSLLRTLPRLGILNLARVAGYRLLLLTRLHPVCRLVPHPVSGGFFALPDQRREGEVSHYWQDSARYFDCIETPLVSGTPDWHYQVSSGRSAKEVSQTWWRTTGVNEHLGDIKDIWDISRFNWVLAFAQRASCGDEQSLTRLNDWLTDWLVHNPPYSGYNWMCGQEASIRVMHLAMAALILGQASTPRPGLCALVRTHLARIRPTIAYALAQDNNHGICEAAALFVGGSWLAQTDGDDAARAWMDKGRAQLEERAARLIADDGGFGMYSVMYHREFLDALCMVEVWRRNRGLPTFSAYYRDRVSRAARWLADCVHPQSGEVPNIGANDGTRLLPLTDTDYRDCRPSVQLACILFCDARAYGEMGHWNAPMHWLDIPVPDAVLPVTRTRLCKNSGFVWLKSASDDTQVFVRFPHYRFRPSHADPLHVDLWLGGRNILRGPGSYRYHADPKWLDYFPGVSAHNTAQFDDCDAMPRLGRFLFGDWLSLAREPVLEDNATSQSFVAGYRHASGATHQRKLILHSGKLKVCDTLSGFKNRAILRWRLIPGDWKIDASGLSLGQIKLTVQCADGAAKTRLVEGWEARCYGLKTALPVFEIEMTHPCSVTTCIEWKV